MICFISRLKCLFINVFFNDFCNDFSISFFLFLIVNLRNDLTINSIAIVIFFLKIFESSN